jgi:alpha-acetolactate decarboxylase
LIAFDGSAHFTTGKGKFVEQAEHDTVPFGSMVSVGLAPGLFIAPHF